MAGGAAAGLGPEERGRQPARDRVRNSAAGVDERCTCWSRFTDRTAETGAFVIFKLLLKRENTFFTQAFLSNHTGDMKQRLPHGTEQQECCCGARYGPRPVPGERPPLATLHHPVPVLSLLTTRCSSSLSCLSFSLNRMRGQGLDSVPFCTRSAQNSARPLGGTQGKDCSRGSCGDSHLPMSCWHLARCALSSTSSPCSD